MQELKALKDFLKSEKKDSKKGVELFKKFKPNETKKIEFYSKDKDGTFKNMLIADLERIARVRSQQLKDTKPAAQAKAINIDAENAKPSENSKKKA